MTTSVYFRPGSWRGNMYSASGWTRIWQGSLNVVTFTGSRDSLRLIPFEPPIRLNTQEIVSLYFATDNSSGITFGGLFVSLVVVFDSESFFLVSCRFLFVLSALSVAGGDVYDGIDLKNDNVNSQLVGAFEQFVIIFHSALSFCVCV